MNKLITLLIFISIVGVGYAQCPEPTADSMQYVCTGGSSRLDDLNVTVGGVPVWYDDVNKTNTLPGSTAIVDGETYYVANDEAGCESDAIPIKVYEQSVEFVVSPDSCIDLGKNVFFIEEGDLNTPVEIEVLNHDGNPHEQPIIWSPVANNEFQYYWGLNNSWNALPRTSNQGTQIPVTLVFNHIRKILNPFELLELDLNVTGDSCPNSQESITIIAGGLEYKEICYGSTYTLQDVKDYYKTLLGDDFEFYDLDTGGSVVPISTSVVPGEIYFIDFDIDGCGVRIPVTIKYAVEAPKGTGEFFYCSEDAWSLIGVTDSQTLADIRVDGDNLTWYNGSMSPISNIGSVVLEDGDVYYVTDTVNGCESEPLKIEITETDCGCLDEELKFYNIPMAQHNTCNMGFIANPAPVTVGTTNGMGTGDNAVYVTPGNDPSLALVNVELPRTSPFAEATTGESFRLNTNKEYQTVITSARKKFVAGEVVAFDFAMVMQNPNHNYDQQPFFQINVYDNQNNIIQTRCIVSDEEDCIFKEAIIPWNNGNMDSKVLYSDWSSVKLDTRSIQGEAGMIEFIVAFCTPTQHLGYAYIDNIFVGDDANTNPEATASFGYIEIETIDNGSLVYDEDCSYMDMNRGEMCEAILPALNPEFPIEVCGKIDFPVNALACYNPDLKYINLKVLKNGAGVGTVPNATTTSAGFCFNLQTSHITSPLYGHFSLEANARFRMNDGSPNAYDYDVRAMNSGFKICPVAACVEDMKMCISADTSPFEYEFDLEDNEEDALSNYDVADHDKYEFSYYTDIDDARDMINPIPNPSAFTATGTHTIYMRLDYDWNEIGLSKEEDCFDIISFEVIVSSNPELPDDPIELEVCEIDGENGGYFDFDDEDLFDAILDNVTVDKDNHQLVFYETQNGADNEDPAEEIDIDDEYFVAVGSDSVWVRIISPGDCYAVLEIELTVNPLPDLLNTNITILACEDGSGNGEGVFNLPVLIDNTITDPTNGYSITYYNDPDEAEQGDQQDAITNPGAYPGDNGEVIYIRVEDPNTGCAIITEAILEVVDAPTVPLLTPLELCDEGNGQAEFDLGGLIPYIQDGNTTLDVDFYGSQQDADNQNAPLPNQHTTVSTTVYVRVGAPGLDCPAIVALDLIVNPNPTIPTDPIELELCADADGSDVAFDLSDAALESAILADVVGPNADYDIEFYISQTSAENATASDLIDPADPYLASVSTTLWVRIIDISESTLCFSVFSIELTVNPLPILSATNIRITACDDGSNNNSGVFDLPLQAGEEIDPSGDYTLTYHSDSDDAEAGVGAIPAADLDSYPGTDGDILHVRIEDAVTGCFVTTTVTLEVVEAPVVPPLDALELCDEGNGQARFELGDLIPYIQDGNTTLDVSFYGSQQDADNQNAPLPNQHTTGSTTVYVRVGAPGLDCSAIVPLDLIVNENPILPTTPIELALCENEDGSDVEFDLSTATLSDAVLVNVSGNKNDYEIEFYTNQTAAENADTADQIDVDILYPVSGTTQVWVRVTNTSQYTECFSVIDITLTVNPLPTINSPVVLKECDSGAGNGISEFNLNEATIFMVGLGSNYTLTYYESSSNAEQATGAISINYTNTTGYNDTVYARIEDNDTGCYIVEPIQLEVLDAPIAQDAELIYCDPNNDGEGIFHLPDADEDITSDPNATISYHRTQADADNDANRLPDTITNNMINNQQYVYVRVEVTGVGCHTVVRIKLTIEETPELVTPSEIFIGCDEDGTGVHVFDLEEIVEDEVIVNLNNPSDYDITYFEMDANGDKGTQIGSPSAYPSQGGMVIVVVANPLTGCSSEVEIELFVAPLPEVHHPAPLELCDVNNPGDEVEEFYLDEATQEITGGDQSLTVTYHLTQEDADAGENALAIPYENTENNQTIYIRVENEWGCVVSQGITLTLVANPLPAPVTPEPLEVCDIDNNGYAYFDLDSLKDEIIGGEPGVDVSFHETQSDAINGGWALSSPYQNIVRGEQVIYARVYFEGGTGCFTIIEIILRAMPSPIVPVELVDLYFCTADVDTGVRVNLTVYEDEIYGNQDRDALDLTYHLTEDAALAGTGAIANPTDFLLNPPTPTTIYVRLGYSDGECYNIVSFILHLVEGPEINDPSPLSQCAPLGEGNPETAVFDLLDKREEMIGQVTGLGIRFYEIEADALAGNNNYIPDPANYSNITNPQTIYIRVIDSQMNEEDSGCVAFTTLTLRVDPNPDPVTPDPIEICHLDNDEEFTIVDLTVRKLQILNHESWDLEYYERYRDAVNGNQDARIATPEDYELPLVDSPKTIYVRVINPNSGCFEIVELEVIISRLPDVLPAEDIEPMVVCVTDGSNRARFDLTEKLPEIFGNQNLDGLDVFFYEKLEDAIEGVNQIIDPENFYNKETPQTIFVGVGNPEIDDCYIGGLTWFEIEVLEGAVAHSPDETYKVCGIPGPNGGVAIFDLENEDLIESILYLQEPDFFDVDFFLTEDDAHEGAVEDRLSRQYENITNPQLIFARVTNKETGCYAIAEVVLEVIVIEDLILEDRYSICTDENGNPMEDADGNIMYPVIDTGLDADGFEFTWYFEGERIIGQVGPSIEADQIGTYTIELISHDTGCTLTLDIEVVESSFPFTYGAEVTSPAFSGLYNIEAWAEGFGDYWYSLDNGMPQQEGAWSNVEPGSHVVTITDMLGCGSVEVVVSVIDYPKFFTPNEDGYHDTWNIPGMADLDPSAKIYIFDRYGKLLKQISPLSEGWDGTFNGKPLPSTDYWFVVEYQEDGAPKEFKGHFSLKR